MRRERIEAWLRARPLIVDSIIVCLLAVIPLMVLGGTGERQYAADLLLLAPLVVRRVAPVWSSTGVSLGLFAQVFLADAPQYGDVALMFALYAIAAYGPTWARWGGLATGFLGAVLAAVDWFDSSVDPASILFAVPSLSAMVLVSWTLGGFMRTRRSYVAGLEERAVQLERDAAQQAEIAAAAERARIAREMHDVVAHSLSVIVVQADGASYAARTRPETASETLDTISTTARESLTEMRRLLGLLRSGSGNDEQTPGPAAQSAETHTPAPSAAELPQLVERVRGSGLPVSLAVDGDVTRVGRAAGLTVYRVVQEALTNTLKHAGPGASAAVDVVVGDDEVVAQVDDDGRGGGVVETSGTGHGIVGIRERIAVHAGSVDAGPRPGGGFRVRATIPYDGTVSYDGIRSNDEDRA